jgi:transmembrane sensor
VRVDFRDGDSNALAASWDARLRSHDCSPEERDRFTAWLAEDVRHREAFDRLQAALSALREAGEHPLLRALRESARVVELRGARRRLTRRWAVAASFAAVIVSLGFWSTHRGTAPGIGAAARSPIAEPLASTTAEVWVTAPGKKKTIALPDGSLITLNASTRIESEWLPHERRIRLMYGQALFHVAKDKSRPFIVTVGDRAVTAVGTAFDVRLDADKVQVTLLEGRVVVTGLRTASSQPILELTPSQQLLAVDGSVPTVRTVDAVAEAGWAEGQVFFADEALPEAVAEMNQYSVRQIIAGPELSAYRVNGMFRAGNQQGFVSALTSYFPIEAREDSQGRIVLRRHRAATSGR